MSQTSSSLLKTFVKANCKKIAGKEIMFSAFCQAFYKTVDKKEWNANRIRENLPTDINIIDGYMQDIAWNGKLEITAVKYKRICRHCRKEPTQYNVQYRSIYGRNLMRPIGMCGTCLERKRKCLG